MQMHAFPCVDMSLRKTWREVRWMLRPRHISRKSLGANLMVARTLCMSAPIHSQYGELVFNKCNGTRVCNGAPLFCYVCFDVCWILYVFSILVSGDAV